MTQILAEAKNLTKRYDDCIALNQVNLKVQRGDIYGLIGDNGAGKTTFLKILAGHIFWDEGEVTLFGEHMPEKMSEQRKRTGVIIEEPGFYPQLTIEQNMEYYRIQKGIPGKYAVEKALKIVDLWDKKKKKGRELSLGMKQRLGLAIALIGEPELLILDEPINGLDPSGIIEIRNLLLKLNQEKNITVIISSHILSELEQVATVYGFLDKGHMMEQITAGKLQEKCKSYVEIVVSDVEAYAVLLEKKLKLKKYQVLPDSVIQIFNPGENIEIYSRLAGENDIGISRLEVRTSSLEEYYMNLKNGGDIA